MSNLAKLDFLGLDITGKKYLSWVLDAEIHLNANSLGNTIKDGNQYTNQENAKAMIFLCHHLHEALKTEYLTVKDPLVLWNNLKDRYDHQKTVILPKARYDWIHLRHQDFKSISEYNSVIFRITSQLILCGEKITDAEMLEKTFSTFHASNVLLQQQYRERISCLLFAEQNNELLMQNHETHPTDTTPLLEANMAAYNNQRGDHDHRREYGRGHGRGRGRGYSRGDYRGIQFKNMSNNKKWQGNKYKNGGNNRDVKYNACYRCGSEDHWVKTCHTPEHLVELYQKSLENKENGIETNLAYENDEDASMGDHEINNETTHLDDDDFLTNE